jgi:3-hydroxyacyl-CoA dehydrogenase/enoyl-CoA hydratase/carnithine racemase
VTEVHTGFTEHGGFRFAVLTLANEAGRPATLGPVSLDNLAAALDAVDTSAVDAVAVTGADKVFCAGADLKKMVEARTREQAEAVARHGLDVFARLAVLPVPTFAFLNGAALGGGLELALHTDYRTVSDAVRAIGFPEVRLGLVPGWAGIPRTVALTGLKTAARLVVTDSLAGRNLSADDAAALNLVDEVLPAADFLSSSLDFAAGILAGRRSVDRTSGDRTSGDRTPADTAKESLEAIRVRLDERLHGAAPAPYRALDLITAAAERTAAAGTAEPNAETIRTFGELLLSDEARASIYAFHLTQSLAKNPAGRPDVPARPVRSVGVIGAGLMASQLALVFARQLCVPVLITDLSRERVDAALEWMDTQLAADVKRGRLDADNAVRIRALITGTTDKADFAACDAVIEAVFEELSVKQAVFAEVEPLLRPDVLLLTNTSSLSVEAMGAGLAHPERLLGFHFFNPVAVLPLLEIVRTPRTDETSLATAFELAVGLRKTAVLVSDTPGFVVNRLLTRLFSEVLALIDAGGDPAAVDRVLDPLGLPMRPLALLRFIGPVVQQHICETMHRAWPGRFLRSPSLAAVVDAGLPGYLDDAGTVPPEVRALLPEPADFDPADARAAILAALAEEAEHMLAEGVVAGPEQIDLCMILGANYPFHTGGLTPLLDRLAATAKDSINA